MLSDMEFARVMGEMNRRWERRQQGGVLVRIWTDEMAKIDALGPESWSLPFRRALDGQRIERSLGAFLAWLDARKESGAITFWAGRWHFASPGDAVRFYWDGQNCTCSHPMYREAGALSPGKQSIFFAGEAWKKIAAWSGFWAGIGGAVDRNMALAKDHERKNTP